jgi:hypothetical protein
MNTGNSAVARTGTINRAESFVNSWSHLVNATSQTVENLILDLLEFVAARDRTYEDVMDAWRTSCPRLPVWEDANDRGLISVERAGATSFVRLTPLGRALLNDQRPSSRR